MTEPKGIDPELIPYLLGEDQAKLEEEESQLDAAEVAELLGGTDNDRDPVDPVDEVEVRARVRELATTLFARAPEHDFDPSLARIEGLLDILGSPQDAYPIIHIAGTNGKTSTARIADALLGAFDLKVGRFTSPHLRDIRERITVEGEPLSPQQFVDAWDDIAPYVAMMDEKGSPKLSFFEVLTAMAYAAFADYPVDVAVIETGMGGVWDATNVANAGVAVLTHIDRDHQQWLGDTLEEIATEKVGIIKEKTIVVAEKQTDEVEAIIRDRCSQTDSVLWMEGVDWEVVDRQPGVGGQMITLRTPAGVYEDLFVPLLGKHQASNAGAALVAVEAILGGKALKADVVDAGMQGVRSPGRLEVLRGSPAIVVDSAHNPDGAAALGPALVESFAFDYTVGVYSAMRDKNIEATLAEMEPFLDAIVVVPMDGPRAAELSDLEEIAADVFDEAYAEEGLVAGIDRAAALVDRTNDPQANKGIVIFGSVVLAGEATALLRPDQRLG